GLTGSVQLLGERSDIADLNNAFDVACLASRAEAFPNAVGESMACGVPCVVTHVGECAEIVGRTGRVVEAGRADLLAGALLDLLNMTLAGRHALGRAARERVIDRFDMDHIAHQYEKCFREFISETKEDGKRSWRRGQ